MKKFDFGRQHARELFSGMNLPTSLDQVVVHGYVSAPERHRVLGGGRLITSEELTAEIMHSLPERMWSSAVPEQFPLLRTPQIAKMAGARVPPPAVFLLPEETTQS